MLTAAPRATGEHVPGTFDSALQHFPSASMEHATMSGSTAVTRLNIVNLLAYVLNVAITWGSQLGWFGATNQEQSLKYQTLVTPIGFAFSMDELPARNSFLRACAVRSLLSLGVVEIA